MRIIHTRLCIATLAVIALFCVGMVIVHGSPDAPPAWPDELREAVQRGTLFGIANLTQEDLYEFPLTDRGEFERLWPALLKLQSPGAPLALYRTETSTFFHHSNVASVRIHAPVRNGGPVTVRSGKKFTLGPPWPDSILDMAGHLPAFVVATEDGWKPVSANDRSLGFHHRVRTEIDLVVDGVIIDLNRIPLPENTLIFDRRKLILTTQPATAPATSGSKFAQ
jgi:hypothetical protein